MPFAAGMELAIFSGCKFYQLCFTENNVCYLALPLRCVYLWR